MDVYLGRQPILDRRSDVVGYELLFRSSRANFCDAADAATATSQVIVNAVLGVGLDRLLGGKPAFINFDRALLLGDLTTLLSPDRAVIEILETVPADAVVLSVCHRLREQGYTLALDDCMDDERTAAFAPFVDILKVDFQQTPAPEQEKLVLRYRGLKIKMVAEKVETDQEFRQAVRFGFDYFQGFFFARPTVLQASRIPASQVNGLRLMKQTQKEELDFSAIEDLVRHDISFTHSLLKYLNSAAFNWSRPVESVRQGLLLLGADEIRKWAWMACLSDLGRNRPRVLMMQVLMRGRFCEMLARLANLPLGEADPFLLGMFSLLDAILERPLEGILNDLNIGSALRNALLGAAGPGDLLSTLLNIVKAYEAGNWKTVEDAASSINLSAGALTTCYLESLYWADAVSADERDGRPAAIPAPEYMRSTGQIPAPRVS
ncbi:MAG TPA: HDOD domain-containing protein [Bryobacteraceae bacterium]|nr:HDOD domain-containing protein [Bryobacteraceae bacterium]